MTGDLESLTDPVRDRAIKQLKKRHDLMTHLLVYVLVNTFIVVIWAITNSGGFFWPVFPIVGWGHRPGHERMGCLAPG
jgi:2TM domain-containing protein